MSFSKEKASIIFFLSSRESSQLHPFWNSPWACLSVWVQLKSAFAHLLELTILFLQQDCKLPVVRDSALLCNPTTIPGTVLGTSYVFSIYFLIDLLGSFYLDYYFTVNKRKNIFSLFLS